MTESSKIVVRITDWADPAGADLRALQLEEILADIEGEEEEGSAPSATDIEVFVVMELNGTAIACAGLRRLPPEGVESGPAAEVKRMYVAPEQRGSQLGVTAQLMKEIETEARSRGYKILKLATGTRMHRARAFYEKHGFVQVPLLAHYAATASTICYAKALA